jgi:hypothetical protein
MPRRLASAWTSSGGVAHSGSPSADWTPSLATADAVEWQCRSTRLVVWLFSLIATRRFAELCRAFVTFRVTTSDAGVNADPGAPGQGSAGAKAAAVATRLYPAPMHAIRVIRAAAGDSAGARISPASRTSRSDPSNA